MAPPTSTGIASRLVDTSLLYIASISSSKFKTKRRKDHYFSYLSPQLSRFKLWAHGFHDQPDELGNSQKSSPDPLDEVLEKAVYLMEPTTLLLSEFASCLLSKHFEICGNATLRTQLGETLQEATQLIPDAKSMLHDDESSMELLIEDLHGVLDCLFALSSSLNDVLEDLQAPTASKKLSISIAYRDVYLRYIRDKFPYAQEHVIQTSADGNVKCRDNLSTLATQPDAAPSATPVTVSQEAPLPNPMLLSEKNLIPTVPLKAVERVNEGDGTLRANSLISSRQPTSFHDSGIGTSISAGSFQAPATLAPPASVSGVSQTTVCSIESSAQNRPRVPAMPKDSRSPMGFSCYVCHQKQAPMSRPRQWRKHLFSDLSAYTCLNQSCHGTEKTFRTRNEWISHEKSHDETFQASKAENCPFCLKEFYEKSTRYYSHVGHHMEDIRLFALPLAYQETGIEDDFDNSSATGASDPSINKQKGELSTIKEDDGLLPTTPDTRLARYINENGTVDRNYLHAWISGEGTSEDETLIHSSPIDPRLGLASLSVPAVTIKRSANPIPDKLPVPDIRESRASQNQTYPHSIRESTASSDS